MPEAAPNPGKKSLTEVVTQIFKRSPKKDEAPIPVQAAKPAETDEVKEARLAAYRKLCEEEAQQNPATAGAPKKVKYRAADFNSGGHKKVD